MSHAGYGDFVLLSDDRGGHVGSQSPQAVQLRMGFRGAERYALGLDVFAAFSGKAATVGGKTLMLNGLGLRTATRS